MPWTLEACAGAIVGACLATMGGMYVLEETVTSVSLARKYANLERGLIIRMRSERPW